MVSCWLPVGKVSSKIDIACSAVFRGNAKNHRAHASLEVLENGTDIRRKKPDLPGLGSTNWEKRQAGRHSDVSGQTMITLSRRELKITPPWMKIDDADGQHFRGADRPHAHRVGEASYNFEIDSRPPGRAALFPAFPGSPGT
jgi:hypothetical protein